jgi:tRNA uridine 5-carboxymethylaminomethyl modification enzyme
MENIKDYDIPVPQSDYIKEEIEINIKYDGYPERKIKINEKLRYLENIKIPQDIDYSKVAGLTKEAVQKLTKVKPI